MVISSLFGFPIMSSISCAFFICYCLFDNEIKFDMIDMSKTLWCTVSDGNQLISDLQKYHLSQTMRRPHHIVTYSIQKVYGLYVTMWWGRRMVPSNPALLWTYLHMWYPRQIPWPDLLCHHWIGSEKKIIFIWIQLDTLFKQSNLRFHHGIKSIDVSI